MIVMMIRHGAFTFSTRAGNHRLSNLLFFLVSFFILISCSPENRTEDIEKFPVTHPIVRDTVISKEYVADIQSIQNVELRARVNGFIEKIHVDEGQYVKAGQALFSLSKQGFQEELLRANAMLKSAIAESKVADVEVKRTQTLVDKNIVSHSELELAKAKLEAIEAKIDEARSSVSTAQLNLSFSEVRAPFDGIINRIPNKIGSLVDGGELLTTISNNDEVFAYFNMSEPEYLEFIRRKNSNKEVSLTMADNRPYRLKGIIETVESEIDKNTGTISFRARFANPDNLLKHGASGKIHLSTELKNALLIPQKSTFEIQENVYVYVVTKGNIVQMRSVVPIIRMPQVYIIQSGLTAEDTILFEGIQRVKDGDSIQPELIVLDAKFHTLNQ